MSKNQFEHFFGVAPAASEISSESVPSPVLSNFRLMSRSVLLIKLAKIQFGRFQFSSLMMTPLETGSDQIDQCCVVLVCVCSPSPLEIDGIYKLFSRKYQHSLRFNVNSTLHASSLNI